MKLCLFTNATILDATKDMLRSIDKSDFSQEHIVVVPDKYSLQAEKTILELLGDSLFNVRVLGLTKLASEILSEMGVKCEVVSEGESLLLTQKAIDEVAENFKVFKRGDFGFCQEMNKLISQLKSSCVESGELAIDAQGLSGGKYHDIKLVYDKYNEFLGGRLDANGKLLLASRFAKQDALKDKHYYFGYFEAFTAEGYKLLDSLVKFAQSVSFACASPLSLGNDYLYEKDIKEKLIKLASANGAMVSVKKGEENFSPIKNALLRGVMSYEKIKLANNGFFTLLGASGIEEEVSFVAKTIFYLLNKGYKYSDMAIFVSDLVKYQNTIKREFDMFNFIYFLDSPLPADNTLLVRALESLFAVAGQGYQKEHLISLLSNPILKSQPLVQKVLAKDISGKRAYKIYLSKDFTYNWFFDEFDSCGSVKDYSCLTRKFLSAVKDDFDRFWAEQDEEYLKEESINVQAFDLTSDSLDLLEKYDSLINADEFVFRLTSLLKMTDLSSAPSYIDGLSVGDATSSSMEGKKIVFILGGQDLPCQVSEGGLLSDDELKENVKKEISPSLRMINRRNRFKLFSLLATAQERLILTYQTLNDEGKKNEIPSYMASLNEIFSQREEKLSAFLEAGTLSLSGRKLQAGNKANFIQENYAMLSSEDKEKLAISAQLPFEGKSNRLQLADNSEDLFFPDKRFSASQLETYFSCPFKHFVRYGLSIKDNDQKDFSPADIGNICHKMAELFVERVGSERSLIENNDKTMRESAIKGFVNEKFAYVLTSLNLQEKLNECEDKKQIEKFLRNYLISFLKDVARELVHSALTPLAPEKAVSQITLSSLSLKGRADRVDAGKGFFKIVDYKTGKTKDILKELYYGNKLQLFLYADAIEKETGLTAGGVFYFNAKFEYGISEDDKKLLKGLARNDESFIPLLDYDIDAEGKSSIVSIEKSSNLKKGPYKGRAVASEDFSLYQRYALNVASQGLKEIKEGYIEPKPSLGACERCSYRGICLYNSGRGERLTNGKVSFSEENKID